jgi:hypothetical protein
MLNADARDAASERATHQRLGLGQPVGGLKQVSQGVETDRSRRVLDAEARLVDRQRPAHQWLGIAVHGLLQQKSPAVAQ